jgi:hypothetical protein
MTRLSIARLRECVFEYGHLLDCRVQCLPCGLKAGDHRPRVLKLSRELAVASSGVWAPRYSQAAARTGSRTDRQIYRKLRRLLEVAWRKVTGIDDSLAII